MKEEFKEIVQDLVRLFNFKFRIVILVKFVKFVIFALAWELLVLLAFFELGLKRSNLDRFQKFLVLDNLKFCQKLNGYKIPVVFFHFTNFSNSNKTIQVVLNISGRVYLLRFTFVQRNFGSWLRPILKLTCLNKCSSQTSVLFSFQQHTTQ